ncbi:L-threonine 3-dehydrogenase [soil metagenome]
MKALVYRSQNDPAIVEFDVPALGSGEVLIRSCAVGICHSDIDLLTGRYTLPVTYPVTPGHEWAGEVAEVGPGVEGFIRGDRVVGECVVGQNGRIHFGFNVDGAAAELFRVRAEWLHKIPDTLSWTQAALVEPVSIAYNASICLGGVYPGDTVAVFGAGPIGLLSVMVAKANGARVVSVEPNPKRRDTARTLGAVAALDPTHEDFSKAVADLTLGRGFDGVVEASGSPAAMAQALQIAADSGRIAYVGINVGSSVEAPLGLIQSKALRIRGAVGSAGLWPQVIRLLASGVLDPTPIVTTTVPLSRAVEGIAAAHDPGNHIKIHIRPD